MSPSMLDAAAVVDHLRQRGIIPRDGRLTAEPLSGGVSGAVWRVRAGGSSFVVKQALPKLLVSHQWLANPHRTVTEGRALQLAATVDPARVPGVIDIDDNANVLVMVAAASPTATWKEGLLEGRADPAIATKLAAFLAAIHARTRVDGRKERPDLRDFDQDEAFAELRLRPYFESIAARRPALSTVVMPPVLEMRNRRQSLVHGDVSPKNVLVGPQVLWLLDWEVAHLGDPAFDLAFLTSHLLLKSIHRPAWSARYLATALAFLASYAAAGGVASDDAHLCALTGALVIARVDGDSPVEYLDQRGRDAARSLGERLAADPQRSLRSALAVTGSPGHGAEVDG